MHFTLQSGQRTVTVTSRCPVCLQKQEWPLSKVRSAHQLFLWELCCTEKCQEIWRVKLLDTCKTSDPDNFSWYQKNIACACITENMQSYIDATVLRIM